MVTRNLHRRSEAGFTIVEIVTVTAVIGVLIAIAGPAMVRFKSTQDARHGISRVSDLLRNARSSAITQTVPHLVLFPQELTPEGRRSTFAVVVRDNDRTYSLTPPDDVNQFQLDSSIGLHVRQYGEDDTLLPVTSSGASGSGSALDGDYMSLLGDYSAKMADGDSSGDYSDVLAMYEDKAEDWASGGNPGCSGAGPCLDPGHPDYE